MRSSFNTGWSVKPKAAGFFDILASGSGGTPVTLPHDAMIGMERSAEGTDGPSAGFFPGGTVEYTKTFDVPEDWRRQRVSLQFDGVYRDAMVFVNDQWAGQRPNGYVPFRVPLDAYLRYGRPNVVRVECRAYRDSRWYSGLGIHRDTALVVTPLSHIAADGVRVTTPDVDDERAVVAVATTVQHEDVGTRTFELQTEMLDRDGRPVATDRVPVTVREGGSVVVRQRVYVLRPELWSVDRPYLYEVRSTLHESNSVLDSSTLPLGIRTLRLDPMHGLRINGETVNLRGACVHHDNGILGAAAHRSAEERRVRLLKAAGFNAIRSSHNPISSAMLDACDRLGMLVVDEAFDMWFEGMKTFDYSLSFAEWWARDLEAMVTRDVNHPSVVVYSIGNEVPEAGSPLGGAWGRELAEKVRSLDDTRFTTNAVSSFWAVSAEILDDFRQEVAALESRGVNDVMGALSGLFEGITASELVTERTAETHAAVDVTGLNYAEQRYVSDATAFPNRVMLGTETNPRDIARNWALVSELPYVIGDFTWTGWDYLGEAGLGRTDYTDDPAQRGGGDPAFPWLLAWCGDIDITGHRRPASYYREIVFGLRSEPYIAVFRPEHHGLRRLEMPWAWSDAVASWTWDVRPGSPVEVEVYSGADEVELLLDGVPVGRAPAGRDRGFRAHFDVEYRPGMLTAVAYVAGEEQGRTSLTTAQEAHLVVGADTRVLRADRDELAFVSIELRDTSGNLANSSDREVNVEVAGAGVLLALGSARPVTDERYDSPRHTTFDGRALAVVRTTGAGAITVTVAADGLETSVLELESQSGR